MRLPKGMENQHRYGYFPERHTTWSKRPNPCTPTRHCGACGRVIDWVYRNGVLWSSPMYYCAVDKCQQVRAHKTTVIDEYEINRPAY